MLPIMFDYTEKILHIWQRGGKWSLNLKEQIYMLSLERHSNITRAAKELGISQPALTTFLNHLEKDLDVKSTGYDKRICHGLWTLCFCI